MCTVPRVCCSTALVFLYTKFLWIGCSVLLKFEHHLSFRWELKADETACGRQITALECGRANFHWVASSLHLAAGEQPEDLHSCTSYPRFLAEKIGPPRIRF